MRTLLITLVAIAVAVFAGRALYNAVKSRPVDQDLGGFASVRVPGNFEKRGPLYHWYGAEIDFVRSDPYIWHIGSATPWRAQLYLHVFDPRLARRHGDALPRFLGEAFEHMENATWETWQKQGAWRWRLGEGRYTPNTLDIPSWQGQAMNVDRGVVAELRVWKSSMSREKVIATLDEIMRSYRESADVAAHMASVPRWGPGSSRVSLPIELWDPYSLDRDATGAVSEYYQLHRGWAEDTTALDRRVAVLGLFKPGESSQEQATRAALIRRSLEHVLPAAPSFTTETRDGLAFDVAEVSHDSNGRAVPAWLVLAVDAKKGAGLAYRVWQSDATRDEAIAVVARSLASYEFRDPSYDFFTPRPPE